jgi:hypothetical protein
VVSFRVEQLRGFIMEARRVDKDPTVPTPPPLRGAGRGGERREKMLEMALSLYDNQFQSFPPVFPLTHTLQIPSAAPTPPPATQLASSPFTAHQSAIRQLE